MNNKLERKYGLFTAICMVVGIVIGSGVFFKAQTILQITNGDMPLGVIAWLIGGAIMLACILTFAGMSQKYEKVNGIVDYAEATVGPKYGYYMGWFLSTIYYPSLTAALAWLSARYTLVFLTTMFPNMPLLIHISEGGVVVGPECIALMLFYLCCSYAVNALSPKLAGKIQASTTVIKLIPLGIMAIVGRHRRSCLRPADGELRCAPLAVAGSKGSILFAAVCATSFAYEGCIICNDHQFRAEEFEAQPAEGAHARRHHRHCYLPAVLHRRDWRCIERGADRKGRDRCLYEHLWQRHRQHPEPLHRHLLASAR